MSDHPDSRIEIRAPVPGLRYIADDDADRRHPDEPEEDLDLIEQVRDRLDLAGEISDVTIAASLAQIAARADARGRWLAAFGSPLGKHLAMRGSDLNTVLNQLLLLAPRHQA